MRPAAILAALLAFTAPALATSHHADIRRPTLPRRLHPADHAVSNPLAERQFWAQYRGRSTWYGVGVTMGACGKWTTPDTRAVALNIQLYGNPNQQSKHCGRRLRIHHEGVTSEAVVVDCCPTCPGIGDLDMSKILFRDFEPEITGIFQMAWHWIDERDDDDNDNQPSKPKPRPQRPRPRPPKQDDDDDDDDDDEPRTTRTRTRTRTRTSTTTTTSTSTRTRTATADDDDDDDEDRTRTRTRRPTQTPAPVEPDNLSNLNSLISGFQNMAQAGQA